MNPIFISYRRDDNISTAKLLKAILEDELGKDTVFLDTTTMGPGEKWKQALKDAVTNAKVVIALIGPYWKSEKYWKTNNKEDNRLLDKEDWVRLELETALADKNKKIIPMIFYPDKIENFKDSIHFTKDTLPVSLLSLAGENNKAIIHEKQFEDDLKRTIIEISPFVKSEDALADLPLPDYDPRNPLDDFPEQPFKGLDYFTEQDARIFFGRGEQIKELFYKLSANPLVLFYGQSGVGKSSLLFAGLKRRMEKKGWIVEYLRREPISNLAEKLNTYIDNTPNEGNLLLILDQIEEIYTNPSSVLSPENEKFQLIESIENALRKRIHVLLGFREEYLAKIQESLDAKSLLYGKMPLRHMQVKGVLEAIEGITKSPQAKYNYNLSFEVNKDVPQKIAYLVLNDKQSYVAPLLQLLLRKLWDRVAGWEEERIITEKLFDEVKSQSLNDLLNDQIKLLRAEFSNEIDNGLVLDLLYFFTTSRGTSASHTDEELKGYYDYERVLDLTEALKNKYLLTSLQSENLHITRLAHDALAPLVRELYSQSILPAQRASRLLDSKRQDIEDAKEVEFSKPDLKIIDAGRTGMRRMTKMETRVIEESRQRIRKYEMELEEKNVQLQKALLEAQASTLAVRSREVFQKDPTMGLRLAEASCKMIKEPLPEAESSMLDIISSNEEFCKHTIPVAETVACIGLSSDGEYIILGGWDGNVKLLTIDGEIKQDFKGHKHLIRAIVFSPDGNLILTGSEDGTAMLWSLDGKAKQIFKGHKHWVNSVAFSMDGKFILTGSYDKTAKLWSIDGKLVRTFKGHKRSVDSVAFSPNGKFVVTGSDDNTGIVWTLDGKIKQTFKGHKEGIKSITFLNNGKFILSGSLDRTAKLWTLTGKMLQTFEGHQDYIRSAKVSPDDNFILTGSDDGTARLWTLDGKIQQTFKGHKNGVMYATFSQDGKLILSLADESIRLWSFYIRTFRTFEKVEGGVESAVFSPDGRTVMVGSQFGTAEIWTVEGKKIFSFDEYDEFAEGVNAAIFSPDGKFVLLSCGGVIQLRTPEGKLKQNFKGHKENVNTMAFSVDSKFIITGSEDKTAKLWAIDGKLLQTFKGHKDYLSSVAFSPDGQFVLTGGEQIAKLWSIDGKNVQTFEGHEDSVNSVAFSPDGQWILTGSSDNYAWLWTLDGKKLQTYKGHEGWVNTAVFSPDGKYILTSSDDKTARLWSIDGKSKQIFSGHLDGINTATFSPDGKWVLTASNDKTVRLWRPFWEILKQENTITPTPEQMKEYRISEDIEWGELC